MAKKAPKPHTLDLALQGGGAHGAFTWGVLERLLEEPAISINAVSGASAGALNAAVLVSGLVGGGPEEAAARLSSFWKAVNQSARQTTILPFLEAFPAAFKTADMLWSMVSAGSISVSPSPRLGRTAQGILRDVLNKHVDLDAVRSPEAPRIFVSATNARSGAPRIFRNDDLSIDALLASACLPMNFPPVSIDGEDYWDGGYSANPPILPIVQESSCSDLLLVTVNPVTRKDTPRAMNEIPGRISELMFNLSLVKELRGLSLLKEDMGAWQFFGNGLIRSIRDLRLHEIYDEETMSRVDPRSKMTPGWQLLTRLHEAGHRAAENWVDICSGDLGKRSTARIAERYF
ncbi:patatin-like phospholipase family protein [Roseibium aggregatum]|uniref:Patatin-like phospholipase family protein n=1 Tax=Roseibium aggregatum TaxID=187304 RepID=A0A926S6Y7_9HYPH|nr:patatin-like phospholipase family protein [Roseibium aggregatum]MBD1546982.1 patatin-like phospholipase family protein [Roseibium aggregatum]